MGMWWSAFEIWKLGNWKFRNLEFWKFRNWEIAPVPMIDGADR